MHRCPAAPKVGAPPARAQHPQSAALALWPVLVRCRGHRGGRSKVWRRKSLDTALFRTRRKYPHGENNQDAERMGRSQARRRKARRQPQQAPVDTRPARDTRPAAMAAGTDGPWRRNPAPAHGRCKGRNALLPRKTWLIAQAAPTEAPAVGLFSLLVLGGYMLATR